MLELLGCSDRTYLIGHDADGDAGPAAMDASVAECEGVHAGAVFCSSFEPAELTAEWDDTSMANAGELERSTERAHTGDASLRAASLDSMSAAVVVRSFAPVSAGELHLRAHVFVPADLPTEILNIFYIGAAPQPDSFIGIDINLEDGALQVFSPQGDPVRQTADALIPRDRWFCLQASIAISDDAGAVDLFVDDALALHATGIDTLPPSGVTQLRAGIDWSSEQTEFFELYIDDVVLDTAQVDCLPP